MIGNTGIKVSQALALVCFVTAVVLLVINYVRCAKKGWPAVEMSGDIETEVETSGETTPDEAEVESSGENASDATEEAADADQKADLQGSHDDTEK